MTFDLRAFEKTAIRIQEEAKAEGRLVDNPDNTELDSILARKPGVRQNGLRQLRGGLDNGVNSPTGFQVPASVRAVDDIYFHPEKLFTTSEFEANQNGLIQVRREAVEKLGGSLHPAVRHAFNG